MTEPLGDAQGSEACETLLTCQVEPEAGILNALIWAMECASRKMQTGENAIRGMLHPSNKRSQIPETSELAQSIAETAASQHMKTFTSRGTHKSNWNSSKLFF